jgi:thiamine phosphate synthase YjbQ (UPF0047 family)
MLRQASASLTFTATRPGLLDVTPRIASWLSEQGIAEGLLTLFCRHTSASLLIQENAAPAARPHAWHRWLATSQAPRAHIGLRETHWPPAQYSPELGLACAVGA